MLRIPLGSIIPSILIPTVKTGYPEYFSNNPHSLNRKIKRWYKSMLFIPSFLFLMSYSFILYTQLLTDSR
ncbi:MAG: hypothetical protein K0R78_70 [Pelosinus sp.]|jgi:hypothetical protein|nr:hypothetical protein [Pelosinus sp.]